MSKENSVLSGNTAMLVLKLLDDKDMYGYQIIEDLAKKSENVFQLKTGTLYPLLHGLENDGAVESYEENAGNLRIRRYYSLTKNGKALLAKKQAEWAEYSKAVSFVMEEGGSYAFA